MSPWTIWSTLHELLYPYHIQRVQGLRPTDFAPWRAFCKKFCGRCRNYPAFAGRILVTDESCFTRLGIVNFHNVHMWTDANPHAYRQQHLQDEFSINVWAALVGNNITGPFELPHRLNGKLWRQTLDQINKSKLEKNVTKKSC
ncbi:hypothetical protein BDFB_015033 [Asbolus verrucosus]|uniref:DDE 3 domain containing protein n=1 Tax=Asbolus verrucosus TaxID=1661398 RepID=A0A482VFV6_ASBVE|nr:hypothetical protein BDFB_015033 [Asbolus verrucosus]